IALQQQLASLSAANPPDQLALAAAAATLASNPMMLASLCAGTAGSAATTPTGATTPQQQQHLNGTSDLYGTQAAGQHHQPFSGFGLASTAASLAQLTAQASQQNNNLG